jgi:sugar fermentation stimulation protein A
MTIDVPPLLLPFEAPLLQGTFVKRYKRFFVDLALPSGETLTVHCANSGSMRSCLVDGAPAWALDSRNPERKLRYSLELFSLVDGLACLNTSRANMLVERFLMACASAVPSAFPPGALSHLSRSEADLLESDFGLEFSLRREAKFSEHTRFDFYLEHSAGKATWIEVKSVSLRLDDGGIAFPDAVTERGQKHVRELVSAAEQGSEAFILFVVMRGSTLSAEELALGFRAAHEIDPAYADLLAAATKKGVKVRILVPSITPFGFGIRGYYAWPSVSRPLNQ